MHRRRYKIGKKRKRISKQAGSISSTQEISGLNKKLLSVHVEKENNLEGDMRNIKEPAHFNAAVLQSETWITEEKRSELQFYVSDQ